MPAFKNRQDYEAWKASREASGAPWPPAGRERSGSDWTADDDRAIESGQRIIFLGLVATCCFWLFVWFAQSFSAYLGLLGPFMVALGLRILIYQPQIPIYCPSLGETLWCLAGIGAGIFSFYCAGLLEAGSRTRADTLVAAALLGGGMIIVFLYGLVAKRPKRRY